MTPELAEAALAAVPLRRARELALWVGPDGRELTDSGVLRPVVAVTACADLGIGIPDGRIVTASRIPMLNRAWEVAVNAGFVARERTRPRGLAFAARDLPDLTCPRQTLEAWYRVIAAHIELPDNPCPCCLTVLHRLTTGPRQMSDLRQAATYASLSIGGLSHWSSDPYHSRRHARDPTAWLADLGVADEDTTGRVTLTKLGRLFGHSLFRDCAPSPTDTPAELVAVLARLPSTIARAMAGNWIASRGTVAAARELLSFAEHAPPEARSQAIEATRLLGDDAAPAWRELAERSGFGAYGRQWLARIGEPAGFSDRDQSWLLAESIHGSELAERGGNLHWVLTDMLDRGACFTQESIQSMAESGHPETSRILGALFGILIDRARPPAPVYDFYDSYDDEFRWIPPEDEFE